MLCVRFTSCFNVIFSPADIKRWQTNCISSRDLLAKLVMTSNGIHEKILLFSPLRERRTS